MPKTEMQMFHHRLRRLINIDLFQLVEAGVIALGDFEEWAIFKDNPWRWFIKADDERAAKVWAIMEQGR